MSRSPIMMRVGAAVLVLVAILLAYFARTSSHGPDVATTPEADAGVAAIEAVDAAPPPRAPVQRAAHADPRPDILLFTIDTLRADHLSAYGYDRETSPALAALAARGTRFERGYSTSSWTVPSVTSLLTGVLPSQHGVFHSALTEDHRVAQESISATLPSLAQTLHDSGYHTVAVTANGHLASELGFGRGFDDYECLGFAESDAVRVAVSTRLEALRASDRPYFLWVHLVDPHVPYDPAEPQFTEWWPASRPRYPQLDEMVFAVRLGAIAVRDHIPIMQALEYVKTAYDSEIRDADNYFAELIGEIDDGHLAVVFTSDHGEEFNDHHGIGHGNTLFEEVTHVPLIVAIPGQTPSVSTALTSILDVFPTLVDIADEDMPAGPTGHSLLPATRGEPLWDARDIVMETGRGQVVHAIFDGRFKYGERLEPNPIEVLFDLENDPYEEHQCIADHPDVAAALRQRLHDTLAQAAALRPPVDTDHIELPPAIRAQLEALGYGN